MASEAKHSALPWRVERSYEDVWVVDNKGDAVLHIAADTLNEGERIAAFIVRACNAFERLVGALEQFGRHKRGCHIKPDSPAMRALQPKGEMFVAQPCDCGFTATLAAAKGDA